MEFDITSRKNPALVRLKRLGADASARREEGEFVGCGEKLLREAILNGAEIRCVYYAPGYAGASMPAGAAVYSVPGDVLDSVSPFPSAAGVLFTCAILPEAPLPGKGGFLLAETVQDPGNLGTVIRTANAFGVEPLVLMGECADVFHPRTVRASMGAVFRQKICRVSMEELRALRRDGLRLYGAALEKDSVDVREVDLRDAAVAVGSEGHGLSRELLAECSGKVIIPMRPECESLNAAAAAAVLCWEMRRAVL